MNKTLYEELGGEEAIREVARITIQKVVVCPQIGHYFKDTDPKTQEQKLVDWWSWKTGGPNNYNGEDMYYGHIKQRKEGLCDKDFDGEKGHFKKSCEELGVSPENVKKLQDIFEKYRGMCLGKETKPGTGKIE